MLDETMHRYSAGRIGLASALCAFCCGALFSVCALAGLEEDYQAGVKSFRNGDVVGSMVPLRAASVAGHPKAQALLAEILDRTDFDEDALVLYRKSAEQGDPDGMFGLGVMIVSGEGTKRDLPAGRTWIVNAAELNQELAINVIAQAYLKGELGYTEADRITPEALNWVKRAASNDYLPAVDALANAYATGNGLGVAIDRALAEQYQAQGNRIKNIDPSKSKKKQRRM